MTILNQEKELRRRQEAWRSLDVEQQNSIKSGLIAATERCRNHTVLLLREPTDSRRRKSIDLIVGTGVLTRSGRRQGILTAAHVLNAVSSLASNQRGILGDRSARTWRNHCATESTHRKYNVSRIGQHRRIWSGHRLD